MKQPRNKKGRFITYSDYKNKQAREVRACLVVIILTAMLFTWHTLKQNSKLSQEMNAKHWSVELTIASDTAKRKKSKAIIESKQRENAVKIERSREAIGLQMFLESVNSPIADKARHIIDTAEKYGLDYKIIVAIAGTESSYWKNCHDWNCYGWGVTDSGYIDKIQQADWSTFESGLDTFCNQFARQYKGLTINEISLSGYNARQEWRNTTNYIYNLLDN